jgi:hypothetical protein
VRRLLALALLAGACRDQPVAERRAEVAELCATYCPQRIDCVADGFAGGSVRECERKCIADERPLEDSACGEASLTALQCLTEVACEDLAAAVAGTTSESACYAEVREQHDRCDLTPLY